MRSKFSSLPLLNEQVYTHTILIFTLSFTFNLTRPQVPKECAILPSSKNARFDVFVGPPEESSQKVDFIMLPYSRDDLAESTMAVSSMTIAHSRLSAFHRRRRLRRPQHPQE